ncbi:MAG: TlyA family RNA methyltransferase [Bacteroidetes bacterium]|nr:TlyA family RNA methyltransferase [Bacteroidota bacterium]
MGEAAHIRLDKLLVERDLVASRPRAERMISEHGVLVDGVKVTKSGKKVAPNARLELVVEDMPWVSRGALKLLAALEEWKDIEVAGRRALDVGCSTGGFSQVMLEARASAVLGVDTGRDQFDSRLADNPRMVVRESTNVRDLTREEVTAVIGGLPQLVAIDVSFVGLAHIFPTVAELTEPGTPVIALVKPQFEVGREHLSRSGIVRDPAQRQRALDAVKDAALECGLSVLDALDSPIQGGDGNHEYLLRLERM